MILPNTMTRTIPISKPRVVSGGKTSSRVDIWHCGDSAERVYSTLGVLSVLDLGLRFCLPY
jgi:hypothetical protein